MSVAVGIDLGTSTSCVAVFDGESPVVLSNEKGEEIIPSVVSFLDDDEVIVGTPAKDRIITHGKVTVYSAKRLMGRKWFSSEVKKARSLMPYELVEGPNESVLVKIRNKTYTLPEISAFILRELKRTAERNLGEEVKDAVITVPAYFNDGQRQATKDAGTIAGLNVIRIINEPTAAALAYGYGKGKDQKVAVYDLGGGTFDISILQISGDVFEVLTTGGDTYLGGDDFDLRLMEYLADQFEKTFRINPKQSPDALQRLKKIAEETKKKLSVEEKVRVRDWILEEGGKKLALDLEISRPLFKELTFDLVQRTFVVVDEALRASRLNVNDLDGVILVGGSTKMPQVREMVERYFFKKPDISINPDVVVGVGAAIHAHSLKSQKAKSLLLDVTSQSLGIGLAGDAFEILIPRNSQIPMEESRIFTTSVDNQTEVRVRVYQGEKKKASENELLGELILSGIPPKPRGVPKIEVKFEIDVDGIVHVTAVDMATGKKASAHLKVSGGMTEEEVKKAQEKQKEISLA
jgi:molecular chaperone DnaK